MDYTVATIAHLVDIAPNTLRMWTKEFGEYLSDSATPPKGEERRFTNDDLEVFSSIAYLRENKRSYEDIHRELRAGNRYKLPDTPEQEEPAKATEMTALTTQLTAQVARLQGELKAREQEREHLLKQLEEMGDLRQRYADTLERAARAEGRAEVVEHLQQERDRLAAEIERLQRQIEGQTPRRTWWDRLTGR